MKRIAFITHASENPSLDLAHIDTPLSQLSDFDLKKLFEIQAIPPVQYGSIHLDSKTIGYLIAVPLTPTQMLNMPPRKVHEAVSKAVGKAVELGAEVVGLGALTSPATFGGKAISNRFDNITLTNGNSYTAFIVNETIRKVSSGNQSIGIVGATGSVGKCVVELMKKDGQKDVVLFGRNISRLQALGNDFQKSNNLDDLSSCDIAVILTSASDSIIQSHHIKVGGTIIDATIPKNVDSKMISSRSDIRVIDGGILNTKHISIEGNIGLPQGVIYACLAETILLGLSNHSGHFTIGDANLNCVETIKRYADDHKYLDLSILV